MYFLRTPAGIMPMDKVRVRWQMKGGDGSAAVYLEEWRGDRWVMAGWHKSCPVQFVDKFFDELQVELSAQDHGCLNIDRIWDRIVPPPEAK